MEKPNRPLCGIKLPGLHTVPVIVLKLVMKIMVTFAEGEESHDEAVTRRAFAGIRLPANPMAKRVDTKSHVMHENDASSARR